MTNIDLLWASLMANPGVPNPEGTYDWLRRQKHSPLARRLIGTDTGPIKNQQWGQLCRRWREDFDLPPTALEVVALAAADLSIIDVVYPDEIISLSREPSPFSHAFFRFEEMADSWHGVVQLDCAALPSPGKEALDGLVGLAALALILRSGVLASEQLLAIIATLMDGSLRRLGADQHPVYLAMDASGGCRFRVYPDPVTDALCARAFNHPDGQAKQNFRQIVSESHIFQLILARMQAHRVPKANLPTSLGRLLYFASSSLRIFSQPLCLEHAFGSVSSESLSPHCSTAWEFGLARTRVVDSLLPTVPLRDRQSFPDSPWMTDLGSAIRKSLTTGPGALDRLSSTDHFKDFVPHLTLLFARYLLEHRVNGKKALKPITVYYQTRIIAQALSFAPIEALNTEADASAFQASLQAFDRDLISPHHKVRLRKALHHFRQFCPVAGDVKLPFFFGHSGPNAIVIGEAEFQAAKRILRRTLLLAKTPAWQVNEIEMLACLSFRLGLRTSEAWFLEVKDIHLARGELDILIRSNGRYTIKKSASQRRIPAGVLMPKCEREALEHIYHERKKSAAASDMLFQIQCSPETASRKIAGALKLATRNNLTVQHHLRHSFATWLLVRLVESSSDASRVREYFPQGVVPPILSPEAWSRVVRGKPAPARSLLFAVQKLMGHAQWTTTLRNYIHSLDQIWADSALRALAARDGDSHSLLVAAVGLGKSSAYRLLNASGTTGLLRHAWKLPTETPDPVSGDTSAPEALLALDAIAGAVAVHRRTRISLAAAADLFDVPESEVARANERLNPMEALDPPTESAWKEAMVLGHQYLSMSASKRAVVQRGIKCYVARRRAKGAIAVFTNDEQLSAARMTVDAFTEMNIDFDFILFSTGHRKFGTAPKWAGPLLTGARNVQTLAATNSKAASPANWLGIRPRHFNDPDRTSFAQGFRRFANLIEIDCE